MKAACFFYTDILEAVFIKKERLALLVVSSIRESLILQVEYKVRELYPGICRIYSLRITRHLKNEKRTSNSE
jgi:hypothetical protein